MLINSTINTACNQTNDIVSIISIGQHRLADVQFLTGGPVPGLCTALMPLTASVRHKEPPFQPSQHFPSTPSRYISSIMMMAMTDCVLPLPCFPNKSGHHTHRERDGRGEGERDRDGASGVISGELQASEMPVCGTVSNILVADSP